MRMAFYLALKEIWRNRGRFLLFSMVIALITTLVLFVGALAEGLGAGNKEYIEKLNAELIVYKQNVDLSIGASRIDRDKVGDVRRVAGVKDAGAVNFSSASIMQSNGQKLNVALIGVEPGKPGEPPAFSGRGLNGKRAREAILDRNAALRLKAAIGDEITLKVIQGTKEEFYGLTVVAISDGRQYGIQPSVVVPYLTYEEIKPGIVNVNAADLSSNIIVVQLDNPLDGPAMAKRIQSQVSDVAVVDRKTAYENTPGYTAQQSTLNTQSAFALIIGVLVIGGFFQIQTLQKVPQIGMLKAIGAANSVIALAAVLQIIIVTAIGVLIGSSVSLLLSLSFPPTVPIVFTFNAVASAVLSLMLMGPIGGLVSVRYSLKVEPLTALGLSS